MKRKLYLTAMAFIAVGLMITMATASVTKKDVSDIDNDANDTVNLSPPWPECDPPSSAACPDADVNCDGVVTGLDIAVVKRSDNWQKSIFDATNPRADVNRDFLITGLDIAVIKRSDCWQQ